MNVAELTDEQLLEQIKQICFDLTGNRIPPSTDLTKIIHGHDDVVMYPADEIKQYILESIIMGATMQDAFDEDPQANLRANILILFLSMFGIKVTFNKE
jgi:hypothetical protein